MLSYISISMGIDSYGNVDKYILVSAHGEGAQEIKDGGCDPRICGGLPDSGSGD
jgi:hypothetical protein